MIVPSDDDEEKIAFARSMLMAFTPERPMMVGPNFMKDVKECGHFDDLLDRIQVYPGMK